MRREEGTPGTPGTPGAAEATSSVEDAPALEAIERGSWLKPGASFARYTVLERIGEGGMGVVYKAYDPVLDRAVALKLLIHTGAPERLLLEAQALARLSHPNVLVVYEAGVAGVAGVPFLAMEHVEGQSLHAWERVSPRGRDEILAMYHGAGLGLAAAHRAGLVHRDFKPHNVLVGVDGRPRVADFGIARDSEDADASNGRRALDDTLSLPGRIVGTPAYMAPEQARGQRADAASDQYSFCVALYEGLCGIRPADDASRSRAAQLPAALRRALERGLEEEPARRHASMEALLDALYRERGRRRLAALSALAVVPALVIGAMVARPAEEREPPCRTGAARVATLWSQERRQAVAARFATSRLPFARDAGERVGTRLDAYAAELAVAHDDACAATHVHHEQSETMLDLRMACLDRRRSGLARARDLLLHADDEVVLNAVRVVDELPGVDACGDRDALASRMPRPRGPEARARVRAVEELLAEAKVLNDAGKFRIALPKLEAAVAAARGAGWAPVLAEALVLAGRVRTRVDAYEASVHAYREALDIAEAASDDHQRFWTLLRLIDTEGYYLERQEASAEHERRARAILARLGNPPPLRAELLAALANVELRFGRLDVARRHAEEMHGLNRTFLPPEDPRFARSLRTLGRVAEAQGQTEVALSYLRPAAEIMERHLGPDHPDLGYYLHNLGNVLTTRGDYEESLVAHRRAYDSAVAAFGEWNGGAARTLGNMGQTLATLGRFEEALDAQLRTLAVHERVSGPDSLIAADQRASIATLLVDAGRAGDARTYAERAVTSYRSRPGNPGIAYALAVLARVRAATGARRDALALLDEGERIVVRLEGRRSFRLTELLLVRGELLGAAGVRDVEEALTLVTLGQRAAPVRAEIMMTLAELLWRRARGGDRARAALLAAEALPLTPRVLRGRVEQWMAQHPLAP